MKIDRIIHTPAQNLRTFIAILMHNLFYFLKKDTLMHDEFPYEKRKNSRDGSKREKHVGLDHFSGSSICSFLSRSIPKGHINNFPISPAGH